MKTSSVSPAAPFALKIAGIMMLLLYLLDFLLLLLSAKFQDNQWMVAFTTQLVDRGFLPLMGLAVLAAGFWVEDVMTDGPDRSRGLKLLSWVLASILGVSFLLLIPMHVSASRAAIDTQLKELGQKSTQAEAELNAQATQQLDANIAQLEQAIKSGQLGDQQAQAQQRLDGLKKLKSDPKAFETNIAPQKEAIIKQLKEQRQKVESQLQETSMRSGLRAGLGGLLLAIAHGAIGWTGLRQLSASSSLPKL
jgi:hypothetical protein